MRDASYPLDHRLFSAAKHRELCPIVSQSLFRRYSVVIPVVILVVIASPHEFLSRDALKGICNILNLFFAEASDLLCLPWFSK